MSGLLQPYDLHDYEVRAVNHVLVNPFSMLWMDVGLGKTITTLTSIVELMDRCLVFGTLVVAPLRVCQTVWAEEAKKWSHTQGLSFSLIIGTPKERHYALRKRADIYLVNYENLPWLVDEIIHVYLSRGEYPPFNNMVFDEVTKMKDATTGRHKALRRILPYIPYRIGLTGTPASNGYKDLFGQYLAVDGGQRLGAQITDFKEEFFDSSGYMGYDISPKQGSENAIKARIVDITLQMSNAEYATMPPVTFNDIEITLPTAVQVKYEQLEKDAFVALDSGEEVEVFNAAALMNKCLQAANGALYTDEADTAGPRVWGVVHDEKLDALGDILEESAGQPILCLYAFQSDLARITKKFPQAVHFGGSMTTDQVKDLVRRWDAGEIPLLVGHPASVGHGLNLQYGGHTMVWFGLNWSLDLYDQAVGRMVRQGQKYPVIIHRLLAKATLDEAVRDALTYKAATQDELKATINQYRGRKGV